MDLLHEIKTQRFRLFVKKPYLSAGIFILIFSLLIKFVLGLNFYEFFLILALMSLVIEGMVHLLVKEASDKLESVAYIMLRIKNKDLGHSLDIAQFEGIESVSMAFNNMIDDLKSIMGSLKSISLELVQASDMLNTNSHSINLTMDDMADTMDDIAQGATEQACEAEKGVALITNLSEQINLVYKSATDVAKESKAMQNLNSEGMKAVEILKVANKESADTAGDVSKFINSFVKQTKSIGEFVTTINNIAEQTNLLALNAAIEAARAGDAGRGFAVVAEEVRQLADNSKRATLEVEEIMEGIIKEADRASAMMANMDEVVNRQNKAVDNTSGTFNVIAENIDNIIHKIDNVSESIAVMEDNKNKVTDAIENISAVSQEAAATSQEIAATTQEQKTFIEEMAASSKDLNDLALELKRYVDVYKV